MSDLPQGREPYEYTDEVENIEFERDRLITALGRANAQVECLRGVAMALVEAMHPVLAAYRSTGGHVTDEQITAAWAAYDAARGTAAALPGEQKP